MKGTSSNFKIPKYTLGSPIIKHEPLSSGKRTLGERDKKVLYRLANGRCENCNKKIEYDEMQSGHKLSASKKGKAKLNNSVCLCWRCNNLQGTDSWERFRSKQNKHVKTATSHLERRPRADKGKPKLKKPKNLLEIKIKPFKLPKNTWI